MGGTGSGGARARSGPPADPLSIRSATRTAGDWTELPSKRTGPTPTWPLIDPTRRELVLWRRQWRKPQAIMWDRNGQEDEVALYCRAFAEAEDAEAAVAARTLVRQMQDSLGLSIPGLRSHRWKIVADETTPRRAARKSSTPTRPAAAPSASRLTAVPDAAGQ